MGNEKHAKRKKISKSRDFTKIYFRGSEYGKGKAVLAVISQYVKDHPNVTLEKLQEVFPNDIHSLGLVQPITKAKRLSKDYKRFYIDSPIKLKDRVVAVCADFGKNNIEKFLDVARHLGYRLKFAA